MIILIIKKYTIPGVTANYTNNSGIALEMVDGGTMEQIVINNITMFNTLTLYLFVTGQRHSPLVGTMKGIVISNITATSNSLMSCSITGIPDQYAENIKLSHIILNCPGGGRKNIHYALSPKWKTAIRKIRFLVQTYRHMAFLSVMYAI